MIIPNLFTDNTKKNINLIINLNININTKKIEKFLVFIYICSDHPQSLQTRQENRWSK